MSIQDQKKTPDGSDGSLQSGDAGTFRAPGLQTSTSQGTLHQAALQRNKSAGDM